MGEGEREGQEQGERQRMGEGGREEEGEIYIMLILKAKGY